MKSSYKNQLAIVFLLWLLVIVVTILLVAYAKFSFLIAIAIWIVAAVFTAVKSTTPIGRACCINIIAVLSVFLWLEGHWVRKSLARGGDVESSQWSEDSATDDQGKIIVRDPVLGYRNAPNYAGMHERRVHDELGFSVRYTTDENGHRKGWSSADAVENECTVFFGCSFTFGFGLNDEEAGPYMLGRMTNSRVLNLGVNSYGPHQLLAALEFDLFPGAENCEPGAVIYQAIPDHIRRVAGYTEYDQHGPRYVLLDNGELVYTGLFSDFDSSQLSQSFWGGLFAKSYIYKEYFQRRLLLADKEIDLYLAIVAEIGQRLEKAYPDAEFIIVYWDTENRDYAIELDEKLPTMADKYLRVTEIIPDIQAVPDEYRVPLDPHPNARANQAIAEALANVISAVE